MFCASTPTGSNIPAQGKAPLGLTRWAYRAVVVVVIVVVIEVIVAPRILSYAKFYRFSDYDYDYDNDNDCA